MKLRHISDACESFSTSSRMLAPVVVKPDTVSNRASMYVGISPEITNGSAPNELSTIQLSATIT